MCYVTERVRDNYRTLNFILIQWPGICTQITEADYMLEQFAKQKKLLEVATMMKLSTIFLTSF
uniref:Uncharacterized protein n=1 Tax=Arundo donax TaxID=35708 RepID=A0A0A9H3Y7_ARUDO